MYSVGMNCFHVIADDSGGFHVLLGRCKRANKQAKDHRAMLRIVATCESSQSLKLDFDNLLLLASICPLSPPPPTAPIKHIPCKL